MKPSIVEKVAVSEKDFQRAVLDLAHTLGWKTMHFHDSRRQVKPGVFVGSTGMPQPDGSQKAIEVHIFPEAMRGNGEGQRPMNDAQNQTMTNATVTGVAMVGQSGSVKVKLPNMESELVVDPGVPVIAIVPADKADALARTQSGGMRRRLDLAASLIGRPRVLFLDEPTTGLDPRSRLGMWAIIRELVGVGTTLLLTTQYMDEAD